MSYIRCVSTGNSLDCTDTDMEIMNKHEAAVKEMEGAAISWVAQMFGAPLLCVKVRMFRALHCGCFQSKMGGPSLPVRPQAETGMLVCAGLSLMHAGLFEPA